MKSDDELLALIRRVQAADFDTDDELNAVLITLADEVPGSVDLLMRSRVVLSPEEVLSKARGQHRVFVSGEGGAEITNPHKKG